MLLRKQAESGLTPDQTMLSQSFSEENIRNHIKESTKKRLKKHKGEALADDEKAIRLQQMEAIKEAEESEMNSTEAKDDKDGKKTSLIENEEGAKGKKKHHHKKLADKLKDDDLGDEDPNELFGESPEGDKKEKGGHKHHSLHEEDDLEDPADGHKHHSLHEKDELDEPKEGKKHHSLHEKKKLEDPKEEHKHHSLHEKDELDDPSEGHKHHSLSEAASLEDPAEEPKKHKKHSLSEAESLEDPGDLPTTVDSGEQRQTIETTHGYGSHKHNALPEKSLDKMSDKELDAEI